MNVFAVAFAAMVTLVAFQEAAVKTTAFDYSKIDRKLASQPKYVAAPRYALLLVGTEGKTRIWMAMDKSKADLDYFDVLFVDRDADGNLGEEGERFAQAENDQQQVVWSLGKLEFKDPKALLEDLEVVSYPRETKPMSMINGKMNGKVKLYGGYGPEGTYLEFGESLEKAPVLHADPWGPLSFFHAGPDEMEIANKDEAVMFYVGTRGSGPATFIAVDEHFLDLEKDKIFVTLTAKDSAGKDVSSRAQLKEHC